LVYNDKNLKKLIKQCYIHEVITFGFILKMNDLKKSIKEKGIIDDLKKALNYIQQNFYILIYLMLVRLNKEELNKNQFALLCKEKIDEHSKWLNKFSYKKYLINNNHFISLTLRKVLDHLKSQLKIQEETKNFEYINFNIRNIENSSYEDLRELIYNEYLLGSLVRFNIDEETFHFSTDNFPVKELNFDDDDVLLLNSLNSNSNNSSVNKTQNVQTKNKNIKEPYLPPIDDKYSYTLVLDLDETLVHYIEEQNSAYVQVRPYVEDFLREVSKYYELVIFTAATQEVIIYKYFIYI
jgi:hypothetical protein